MVKMRDFFGDDADDLELPEPTVEFKASDNEEDFTSGQIAGILCNPVYAGVGVDQAVISDKMWVKAATRLIDEQGAEQFLVNLLYVLRQTLGGTQLD